MNNFFRFLAEGEKLQLDEALSTLKRQEDKTDQNYQARRMLVDRTTGEKIFRLKEIYSHRGNYVEPVWHEDYLAKHPSLKDSVELNPAKLIDGGITDAEQACERLHHIAKANKHQDIFQVHAEGPTAAQGRPDKATFIENSTGNIAATWTKKPESWNSRGTLDIKQKYLDHYNINPTAYHKEIHGWSGNESDFVDVHKKLYTAHAKLASESKPWAKGFKRSGGFSHDRQYESYKLLVPEEEGSTRHEAHLKQKYKNVQIHRTSPTAFSGTVEEHVEIPASVHVISKTKEKTKIAARTNVMHWRIRSQAHEGHLFSDRIRENTDLLKHGAEDNPEDLK